MSNCMKKICMIATLVALVVLTLGITTATSFAASSGTEGENPGRFKLYTGFTATGGYTNPYEYNPQDTYEKLVDGNKDTKYCVKSEYSTVSNVYCEFESNTAFIPTGYVFTTGRDADVYGGRNPISWTLYGKSEGSNDWEELSVKDDDETLESKGKQDYTFGISPDATGGKKYKIFKLQIRDIISGYPETQLAELQMIGQDTKTVPITKKAATCLEEGYKIDCYLGYDNHFYADEDMQQPLTDDEVIDPIGPHNLIRVPAKAATESQDGNIEYYYCSDCQKKFSDEEAQNEIEEYRIIRYIDADGTVKYLQPDDYSLVTPGTDNWGTAEGEDFLVAPAGETVNIGSYALIKNHVHLILCDGARLNVTGIEVPSKTVLEIHSQSKGENQGYLHSTGIAPDAASGYGCCGIGTTRSKYTASVEVRTGDIKIYGGKVYAKGGEGAPGISVGGYSLSSGDTGNLVINGGEITAEGGSGAAGIGQAEVRSNTGKFTMNGGKLTARAGQNKDISIGTTHTKDTNGITIDFKGGELIADGSIGGEKDSVALSWTSGSDSITAGAFKYPDNVQVNKRFVYDSDNTEIFDPEEYTKDAKIIPAYIVTFNPNNGDDKFKQTVIPGNKVVKPADPQVKPADGTHYFGYWADAATDTEYEFDSADPPESDLEIYAKWNYYDPIRYYDPETETYGSIRKMVDDNIDLTPNTDYIRSVGDGPKWVLAYGNFDLEKPLEIKGNVQMILFRGAKINAKKGIKVYPNSTLTIYANVKEGDDIGRLSATGYSDGEEDGIRTAGISLIGTEAPDNKDGTLKVCGGNIYAKGASGSKGGAAGIGGDKKASGGTTLIYHGSVDADSSTGGAGIGSGYAYDGSNTTTVKIFGGKVDAGDDSVNAPGIGGGAYSRDKVDIDISGGTVHAIAGNEGAGIGTGKGYRSASAATIDITGGSVTAEGGYYGAAIGSGAAAETDVKINLKNADVTCVSSSEGTGIGTGKSSSSNADICISNSDIGMNLWGSSFGIGAGINSSGKATLKITDDSKIKGNRCTRFINCKKPESSADPDVFIDKSELKVTDGTLAAGGIYGNEAVVKDSNISMKAGVCINATDATRISGSTIRQEFQREIQEAWKGIGIGHAGSEVTIDSSDIDVEGKSGIAGADVTIEHSAISAKASGTLDAENLKGCGIYASNGASLNDSDITLSGACGIYGPGKVETDDSDIAITAPKSISIGEANLKNTRLSVSGASDIKAATRLDIDGSTVKNTDSEEKLILLSPEINITGGSDVTAFSEDSVPVGGDSDKLTITDSKVTAEGPVAIGNSGADITAENSQIYAKGNDENEGAIRADKAVLRDTDIVTETDGTGIQAADIDITNGKLDIGGDIGMGQNGAVIKLGWTRKDMEIKTKSYFGTVKISRPFVYKDTGEQIAEAGHYDDVKIAKNKTIIPDASVVTYIDSEGNYQEQDDFTYVTNETTELSGNNWYVIKGNVTIRDRLKVTGSTGAANLILMSGAKAVIEKGIEVNHPSSLCIFGDTLVKEEAGSLELSSNGKDSPLGASKGNELGTLFIYGGKIEAVTGRPATEPYDTAAAIGSATGGNGGTRGLIYFRRAFVTAENEFGAAIGGSGSANPDGVEINSGEVNATVAKNGVAPGEYENNYIGDAIGSGGLKTGSPTRRTSFPITINGGKVRAYNGVKGAAIGAGKSWHGNGFVMTGGTVYARANKGPGIGLYADESRIQIKGGNVFASSIQADGIGPADHDGSVPLEIEWTQLTDSIYASSYGNVTVSYNDEKPFKYKDTGEAVNTASKPDNDRIIVPGDKSVAEDPQMKDDEYVIPADKATAGTGGTTEDTGYDKLVDSDKDTKWKVSLSDGTAYCEFEEISPVIPKGYILTTADDALSFVERNPNAWKLKAKLGKDDEWETLDVVESSNRLTPSNKRGFIFRVDSRNEYKYFRFEIDKALSGDIAQLAELEIFGPKVEDPAQLKASETRVKVGSTADLSELVEKQKGDVSYSIVEKDTGCSVDPDTGVFTAGDQQLDKVTVKIAIADGEYTTGKTLELIVKVTEKTEHPLDVTMASFTYGDTPTNPAFTNPVPETEPVITYSGTRASGTLYPESTLKPNEAGTYIVKVRIEGAADAYEGTADFTISPASVFINWDSDKEFVYDGDLHYPKAYTADQDLADMMRTDGVSIVASRGERAKGEYSIPAKLDGSLKHNYKITNPEPAGTNMIIGSWEYTVDWADDGSTATAHFRFVPGTKTKDVAGQITDVSRTEPTCTETGAARKMAKFPRGETPEKVEYKDVVLPIDPNAHNFGTPEYKWSKDDSMVYAKAVCQRCGNASEETVETTEKIITPPTPTSDGEKLITATFTKAPFTKQTKTAVIPRKPMRPLDVSMADFIYRGTATDPVFTNPVSGATPTIKYSGTRADGTIYTESILKPTEAGTYRVTVSVEGAEYMHMGTADFSITARSVSISWSEDSEFVYDGNSHAPTPYVADQDTAAMMQEDGVAVAAESSETAKGEYSIPAVLSGTEAYNYTIVNPAPSGTNMTIGSWGYTVEWADDGSAATAHYKLTPGTKTKDVAAADITQVGKTDPTCTAAGSVTKRARFAASDAPDGQERTDDKVIAVDPLGHDYVKDSETPSTCSTRGSAHFKCSRCEAEKTEELPLDPNAHTFGEPTYKWSTDNSMVYAKAVCTGCSAITDETVETTEEIITPPTPTTEGKKLVKATFEKAIFTEQSKEVVIPRKPLRTLDVSMVDFIYRGTATDPEYTDPPSGKDPEIKYSGTLANGTLYPESELKPTRAGKYRVKVTIEGAEYIYTGTADFSIAARSVFISWSADNEFVYDGSSHAPAASAADQTVAAMMQTDGVAVAAKEGKTEKGEYKIPAVLSGLEAYNYTIVNPEPSGTNMTIGSWGYTVEWADDGSAATAHYKLTPGTKTKDVAAADITQVGKTDPTCTAAGSVTKRARFAASDAPDGQERTNDKVIAVDPLGHDFVKDSETPSTCSTRGSAHFKCSRCEAEKTEELPLDPNAHTFGEPTYKWSTDNSMVYAKAVCTGCSAVTEETVETTEEIIIQPTSTTEGEKLVTATFKKAIFTEQTKTVVIPKRDDEAKAEERIAAAKEACDSAESAVSAAGTKTAAADDAIAAARKAKTAAEEAAKGTDLIEAVNKAAEALSAANIAQAGAEDALAAAESAQAKAQFAKDQAAEALTSATATGDETLIAKARAQVTRAEALSKDAAEKAAAARSDLNAAKALVEETKTLLEEAVEKISDDQDLVEAIVEATNAVSKAEAANLITENNAELAERSRKEAEEAAKTPGDNAVAAAEIALNDTETYKKAADEAAELAATALEKAQFAYNKAAETGKEAEVEPLLTAAKKAKQDADNAAAAAAQAVKDAEAALEDAKEKAEEAKKKEARKKQKGQDGTYFGKGAALEAAEAALGRMTSNKDPNGTRILPLRLRSTKQTKTSVKLVWNKTSGAKKYVVFGNLYGKNNKMKKLRTTTYRSFNVKKITKKLRKGKYYKFMVIAIDGKNNVVSSSKIVHVATKGNKKASNPKGVKVTKPKKLKVAVKKGRTYRIKAAITKAKNTTVKKRAALRYASSNTKVATVTSKGRIKGVKKGTAKIYVYAQNGLMKTIKVTVK